MSQNNLGMMTRASTRTKTRIFVTVRYYTQEVRALVVDLSATGMALELEEKLTAADGSRVKIESDQLGFIEGTIRWCRGGRIGIQLNLNSNALAQVSSYFRFFHEDIRPVLTR